MSTDRPPGAPARFDVRTVVYLRRGTNPPDLPEDESTALHHAHLTHLADLASRGIIVANGPLLDKSDETIRGMSIWSVDPVEARRLAEQDPAVRPAGSGWTSHAGQWRPVGSPSRSMPAQWVARWPSRISEPERRPPRPLARGGRDGSRSADLLREASLPRETRDPANSYLAGSHLL
ncbi:hypothetical protein ASG95_03200 [Phycicoccus sp. Soil803]|nr:hypothetical protein ASG95_03200 [Phycicoccus sp. Soil803]